jgi:exopolysaccharide production protein ExoZ
MSRLGSIQVLRASAALMVAFGHLQHEAELMPVMLDHAFSSIFLGLSRVGVDLFFVISGFIMVYASERLFMAQGGARAFLARRVARIVPLYWLMTTIFLLTLLFLPSAVSTGLPEIGDVLRSYFFIPYQQPGASMMQPLYKNGWTLNYEMFFYLSFSLFLFMRLRAAVCAMAAVFSLFVMIGAEFPGLPESIRFWLNPIILEFVFGALIGLACLEGNRLSPVPALLLVVTGLTLLLVGNWMDIEPVGGLRPLIWGLPAAMIVAGLSLAPAEGRNDGKPSLTQRLGDASYALYLLHPLIIRVLRIVWDKTGLVNTLNPWFFVLAGIAIMVPAALWMYRWVEKPLTAGAQGLLVTQRPRIALNPGSV